MSEEEINACVAKATAKQRDALTPEEREAAEHVQALELLAKWDGVFSALAMFERYGQ